MIVVTAADYRFTEFARLHVRQARRFGYLLEMHDLGGLGWGRSFPVQCRLFQEAGHYGSIPNVPNRRTMAYHKPFLIRDVLARHSGPVMYCDADAIPVNPNFDFDWCFDVAVTVRRPLEVEHRQKTAGFAKDQCDGWVNAGVMFFNANPRSRQFVERWIAVTRRCRNDQMALNKLLGGNNNLRPPGEQDLGYAMVRSLDTVTYNCYYFGVSPIDEGVDPAEARILHFKEDRRDMLPRFRHLLDLGRGHG